MPSFALLPKEVRANVARQLTHKELGRLNAVESLRAHYGRKSEPWHTLPGTVFDKYTLAASRCQEALDAWVAEKSLENANKAFEALCDRSKAETQPWERNARAWRHTAITTFNPDTHLQPLVRQVLRENPARAMLHLLRSGPLVCRATTRKEGDAVAKKLLPWSKNKYYSPWAVLSPKDEMQPSSQIVRATISDGFAFEIDESTKQFVYGQEQLTDKRLKSLCWTFEKKALHFLRRAFVEARGEQVYVRASFVDISQ